MAARGSRNGEGATLPDAVPFDLAPLTRLSWELGARVVGDDESTLHSCWTQTESAWALSLFEVTSQTVIIRVQTPIGRERFYGAAQMDLSRALPTLDASPDWRRR